MALTSVDFSPLGADRELEHSLEDTFCKFDDHHDDQLIRYTTAGSSGAGRFSVSTRCFDLKNDNEKTPSRLVPRPTFSGLSR